MSARKTAVDGKKRLDHELRVEHITVKGKQLRTASRPGSGKRPPLIILNGIGAKLEALQGFTRVLNPEIGVILFDIPGVGGSQRPMMPFRMSDLAQTMVDMLEHFGYDVATAKTIAEILLPDVITYDVGSMANGAALNGRALSDDVIDAELGIVTNGHITTDCIGPHSDYLNSFPYVGNPHQ